MMFIGIELAAVSGRSEWGEPERGLRFM